MKLRSPDPDKDLTSLGGFCLAVIVSACMYAAILVPMIGGFL